MGTHFFQYGDPTFSEMGTLASRMGTQKAHVCKIDRNKLRIVVREKNVWETPVIKKSFILGPQEHF